MTVMKKQQSNYYFSYWYSVMLLNKIPILYFDVYLKFTWYGPPLVYNISILLSVSYIYFSEIR